MTIRRMPFGKWKGRLFADIDDGYLCWLVATGTAKGELQAAVRKEMARRDKKAAREAGNDEYSWMKDRHP